MFTYIYIHIYVGTSTDVAAGGKHKKEHENHEQFVLTMPGKIFDVSYIVNKKKWFRKRGGRDGAILTMQNLQKDGLGELKEKYNSGSHKVKGI